MRYVASHYNVARCQDNQPTETELQRIGSEAVPRGNRRITSWRWPTCGVADENTLLGIVLRAWAYPIVLRGVHAGRIASR